MSKKHLMEYYNIVCRDYENAIKEIKEFEVECSNSLVEPERVEKLKEVLQPLISNYNQITYLIYLLNKPDKKTSVKGYESSCKKLLSMLGKDNTTEAALKRNKEALQNIKGIKG